MATRAIEPGMSAPARGRAGGVKARSKAAKATDVRARRYDPAETRARVLAAAHMLFSRQGFAHTGTADIAREADVSEGSIFYHFGSKQALMVELGRRHGEAMIEAMEQGYALEDLEPGIIVPRVFQFVRENLLWEQSPDECTECGHKAKLAANPEIEPFYHAAKAVTTEWIIRQMRAAFAKHGITGVEIDLAASFTHHVVGDGMDLWLCAATPAEAERVLKETVRFVRAACHYSAD